MTKIRLLFLVALAAPMLVGCVERRLTFRTTLRDVPVTIYLDGEPIGECPVTVLFEHYGEREWLARAEGHEPAAGRVTLPMPWYEYPGVDFGAQVLWPGTIIDEHEVTVAPEPIKERDAGDLYHRARDYRTEARRELEAVRRK